MAFRPYKPKGLPQIEGGDKPHLDSELKKIGDSLETTRESLDALDTLLTFPTDTLFGRDASGDGDPEYLTVGGGIAFTGSGGLQTSAFTGDVTKAAGGTVLTIAADAVSNSKLANVATATFKGRTTASTGDPEDLTVTQATALLNVFTSALKGLVPASGGGTTNFLRADGNFAAPPAGPTAASASDQETGSSTTVFTNPAVQQRHASAAKAWVKFTGSTGAILASYNVASVTRHGTGAYTVNFSTAFSSVDFSGVASPSVTSGGAPVVTVMDRNTTAGTNVSQTTTTQTFSFSNLAAAAAEPTTAYYAAFGDQ